MVEHLPHLEVTKVDDKYATPPTDHNAEKDSFNFQSTAFNDKPLAINKEAVLTTLESMLKAGQFEIAKDFLSDEHIARTVARVRTTHGDRSSGAVFVREGMATIDDVCSRLGEPAICHLVKERVKTLESSADTRYSSAPLRVFIKREAHKMSKVLQKRWRLIFGMDFIDRLIDELLYHEMLTRALLVNQKWPLKPGFNFLKGGVDSLVRHYSKNGSKSWCSFDAKQHDMTCSKESLELVRDLNIRLCRTVGGARPRWEHLVRAREDSVLYGSIAFSDGTVLQKQAGGIQPSGRLTTIDSNSKVVLSLRVGWDIERGVVPCADESVCMGDDTVFDNIGDIPAFLCYLAQRGYTWTQESVVGRFEDQNFCSISFARSPLGRWVPIPLNWEKNIYALSHPEKGKSEFTGSTLMSLCTLYAYDTDHFRQLHSLLAQYGGDNFRSEAWFKAIVDGTEAASNGQDAAVEATYKQVAEMLAPSA